MIFFLKQPKFIMNQPSCIWYIHVYPPIFSLFSCLKHLKTLWNDERNINQQRFSSQLNSLRSEKIPAFCFPVQPTVDGPAKSCTKRMVETCGNPIQNGINYRFQLVTTGFRWPVHSISLLFVCMYKCLKNRAPLAPCFLFTPCL